MRQSFKKQKLYRQRGTPGVSISARVIHRLLTYCKDKGHVLFTESYYTSPELFTQLRDANTGACEAVSEYRKQLPVHLQKKVHEVEEI